MQDQMNTLCIIKVSDKKKKKVSDYWSSEKRENLGKDQRTQDVSKQKVTGAEPEGVLEFDQRSRALLEGRTYEGSFYR